MKSKSMEEHKRKAPESVNFAVITLSDSKYRDYLENKTTDISGNLIIDRLKKENRMVFYTVIPDDAKLLKDTINDIIEESLAQIILTTGGTGIGSRDITIETLQPMFEKEITGFGELFRHQSYKEIGAGAILSRATAGVYKGILIISMPGSPNAVETSLNLISSEIFHLVKHVKD